MAIFKDFNMYNFILRKPMNNKVVSLLRRTALALALTTASGMASASLVHVTIDTASFGVDSGFIDMNLGANYFPSLATVTLTKLVGFQSAPTIESEGVAAVSGGWQFRSDTLNDLFQSVDFGGPLSFDLAFEGGFDPNAFFFSVFSVAAFGSDGRTLLGHYSPVTGALVDFTWAPAAMTGMDGRLEFAIADPAVTVIPEPGLLALMGIGLAGLALAGRRREARPRLGAAA
ncbi:MAG: NF038129 family PEP-CTERM protein [Massilia sp.]